MSKSLGPYYWPGKHVNARHFLTTSMWRRSTLENWWQFSCVNGALCTVDKLLCVIWLPSYPKTMQYTTSQPNLNVSIWFRVAAFTWYLITVSLMNRCSPWTEHTCMVWLSVLLATLFVCLCRSVPNICHYRSQHFPFSDTVVCCSHPAARTTRTLQRKWKKNNNLFGAWRMIWQHPSVIWACFPLSLFLTRSLSPSVAPSFSPSRNTHTQLTSQKHTSTIGRRGICAFMGAQRPHLENQRSTLSSCLASTQLYMANTIEERGVLYAQSSFCVVGIGMCVCSAVIYCLPIVFRV